MYITKLERGTKVMCITLKGTFSSDNHALVLHTCKWLKKKLNAIEIEGVEPSLLVQAMTCKPFGKQEIDWSTVWLMTFCWCLVIFGFSFLSFLDAQQSWACLSAVIMPSSHPTPPKKVTSFPLPYPCPQEESWNFETSWYITILN